MYVLNFSYKFRESKFSNKKNQTSGLETGILSVQDRYANHCAVLTIKFNITIVGSLSVLFLNTYNDVSLLYRLFMSRLDIFEGAF